MDLGDMDRPWSPAESWQRIDLGGGSAPFKLWVKLEHFWLDMLATVLSLICYCTQAWQVGMQSWT
jgi:hypothetical protein